MKTERIRGMQNIQTEIDKDSEQYARLNQIRQCFEITFVVVDAFELSAHRDNRDAQPMHRICNSFFTDTSPFAINDLHSCSSPLSSEVI